VRWEKDLGLFAATGPLKRIAAAIRAVCIEGNLWFERWLLKLSPSSAELAMNGRHSLLEGSEEVSSSMTAEGASLSAISAVGASIGKGIADAKYIIFFLIYYHHR
jgi:hypothetical protein